MIDRDVDRDVNEILTQYIWMNANIGGTPKLLLLLIAQFGDRGSLTASNRELGRMVRCGPRQVQHCMARLIKEGWITREQAIGDANTYTLTKRYLWQHGDEHVN